MPPDPAHAVVFDLDGTVADSEAAHERALRAAAETRGMTFTPEWFRENCVGVGERGCFRMLAVRYGLPLSSELLGELVARKLESFLGIVAAGGVPAYPGALELVRGVAAKAPVAVCSGSSRGSVGAVLGRLGLDDGTLGATVTSDDISRPKPDPEAYLLTAARLGVPPARCIAIEDSPTGLTSARRAGMRVIAVEHSYPRERLDGVDAVVRTIGELSPELLLGGLGQGPRAAG